MISSLRELSRETIRDMTVRGILSVIVLCLYVLLLRPARLAVTEQLVVPQVSDVKLEKASFEYTWQGRALHIQYTYAEKTKELHYRPQFGFFFILPLLILFFTAHTWKPYLLLVGLHLAASLLAYLCLLVGSSGVPLGFMGTDLINAYLTPALSLAIVALPGNWGRSDE